MQWEDALTERQFWDALRAGLMAAARERGQSLWLQRIETPTAAGVPDVYFATPRAAGWVELKIIRERRVKLEMRPAQVRWIEGIRAFGVPAFVIARSALTGYVHVWKDARAARDRGFPAADFRFVSLTSPADWGELLEVLEGGL